MAGALSPSPFLAPVFGLGSHVLLDVIPHYDFENLKIEFLFTGLILAALFVSGAYNTAILLGVGFAVLPDLENLLWKLGWIRDEQKIFPGHRIIVRHGRVTGRLNLLFQFMIAALCMIFLAGRSV